jgi:hypothetical protein
MKIKNLKKTCVLVFLTAILGCKKNSNHDIHSVYLVSKQSENNYTLAMSFPKEITLTNEETNKLKRRYTTGDLTVAVTLAYHYAKNGPKSEKIFWCAEANKNFKLPPNWELVLDEPSYLKGAYIESGENILNKK